MRISELSYLSDPNVVEIRIKCKITDDKKNYSLIHDKQIKTGHFLTLFYPHTLFSGRFNNKHTWHLQRMLLETLKKTMYGYTGQA